MDEGIETGILIEWPEQEGIEWASLIDNYEQLREESQKAMNVAMSSIRAMAYKVSRTIREMEQESRPDEVEVEFSLKLDVEGGVVIPMVAKTSAGGQFTITFKWLIDKPSQTKVLVGPKQ